MNRAPTRRGELHHTIKNNYIMMKSLVSFLLFMLLVSCSSKENNKKPQFYASVAQSVITPPAGTFMNEPRGKLSTGIHDDLFVKAIAGLEELSLSMFYSDLPADKLYYQDLAYEKLGNMYKARAFYNKLIKYSENHISDDIKINFFCFTNC